MKSPKKLAAAIARRIFSPLVPARKMLPFMCWLNGIAADYDPYLGHINLFYGSARTAVDIGANIGLYTYLFSKRFRHVYAFEMNSEITGWIKQYNPGNIELSQCGLSSQAGTAKYYIPVAHGLNLAGYATLHRDILPEADGCVEKESRVAPLDEFAITSIDFMKIDVEGHELEVLKGAAKTIEQSRPVILIEVQTMNERTVEAWFQALNYRQCRYLPKNRLVVLTEFLPSTGDCLYIPSERLAAFGLALS